jgi:hypothetical protein
MRQGPEVCSSSAKVLVVLGFHRAGAILSMALKELTGNVLSCISIVSHVPRLWGGIPRVRELVGVLLHRRPGSRSHNFARLVQFYVELYGNSPKRYRLHVYCMPWPEV